MSCKLKILTQNKPHHLHVKILPMGAVLMESPQHRANLMQDVQVSHVYHYFKAKLISHVYRYFTPKLICNALCQHGLLKFQQISLHNRPGSDDRDLEQTRRDGYDDDIVLLEYLGFKNLTVRVQKSTQLML